MEWVEPIKDVWWLFLTLFGILGALLKIGADAYRYKHRLERTEKRVSEIREDISYLLRCSFATLDGLKQQGCNGKVVEMYDEMRKFVLTQHGGKEEASK